MSMLPTIHLARPASKGGNPESTHPVTWCGTIADLGVDVTIFHHRATCQACIELDGQHREDLDYRRNMARLQVQRQLEATG